MRNDADLEIGSKVYLRCADERRAGMVTGILIEPSGRMFRIGWGHNGTSAWHYAIELSTEYVTSFEAR